MTDDLVVIVTVYNGESYLNECLDSCLTALPARSHVVVVDDGSLDRSYEIAKSYPETLVSAVSLGRVGRGRALNYALKHRMAEYYAILDADDRCFPDRFHVQLNILRAYDDIDCLCSKFTVSETVKERVIDEEFSINELIPDDFFISNPICHSTVMFRASVLEQVGIYDSSRSNLYDLDYWVRLLIYNKKIGKSNDILVFKRIHRGQYFESRLRIKYLLDAAILKVKLLKKTKNKMSGVLKILLSLSYGFFPMEFRRYIRRFL